MQHIPHLKDLSPAEIQEILSKAAEIKASPENFTRLLAHQSLAMLFQKTSTRTWVSFEVGMTELGGHAIYMDWSSSNFLLSSIEYETEYLSRNVSCILARLLHHSDLQKMIAVSRVPVINGCCEKFHPCQALTDILTMTEYFEGDISDARLAYVGVQNNVSNSLAIICHKLGISLTLATPARNDNGENLDPDVQNIIKTSETVNQVTDPREAVDQVDFVYTDTWIDMQYFNQPERAEDNKKQVEELLPYQLNEALIQGQNCHILHDMPIHEGFEITAGLVRDPRSIIFEQAGNRLHAQKGLLWWLYQEAGKIPS